MAGVRALSHGMARAGRPLTSEVEVVPVAGGRSALAGAAQRRLPLLVATARRALPRDLEAVSPPEHADLQRREWGLRRGEHPSDHDHHSNSGKCWIFSGHDWEAVLALLDCKVHNS